MGEYWHCQSEKELDNFCTHIKESWDWKYPLKIEWGRFFGGRTLPQNALLHIWCREIAKELSSREFMDEGEMKTIEFTEEYIKTTLKREFGIVDFHYDPIKGVKVPHLRSTTRYDKGEMYEFLLKIEIYVRNTWGVFLESRGEYAENKKAQDG